MRVFRNWPVAVDGEACPQAGQAAPRDASWYGKPGIARVRHVVAADGGSACQGAPLVLELAEHAVLTEWHLRCRRNGCRGQWPGRMLRYVPVGTRLPAGSVVTVASPCCLGNVVADSSSPCGYSCGACRCPCLPLAYAVIGEEP